MADESAETGTGRGHRDAKAELDERRIAKAVAIGLPVATASLAVVAGVIVGAPMAILILASGMLLGVIALFWASLRILSGDAALSPELEALDATAHAVDALASRKKMLIRALKDLDNERALGKLDDEDYEQLSQTYRGELKEVLTRIDASLAPHRPKAEDAARSHLLTSGITDRGSRGPQPVAYAAEEPDDEEDEEDEPDSAERAEEAETKPDTKVKAKPAPKPAPKSDEARVACTSCETSNEPDATFCKKCGASLAKESEAVDEA
jgi:hypothetical protein